MKKIDKISAALLLLHLFISIREITIYIIFCSNVYYKLYSSLFIRVELIKNLKVCERVNVHINWIKIFRSNDEPKFWKFKKKFKIGLITNTSIFKIGSKIKKYRS